MRRHYGNYLGYVIANNSPLKDGRVKVFVPAVNGYIFDAWNSDQDDKFFNTEGTNLSSLLTPEISTFLEESLPWSRISQPIIGGGASGYINQGTASVSDGNFEKQKREAQPEQETSNVDTSEQKQDSTLAPTAGTSNNVTGTPTSGSAEIQATNEPINTEGGSFQPRYPKSAYRESGVYRTKSDPYAVGAVSHGRGDHGGVSYGTYQFASRNSSELNDFMQWESNPYRSEFQGLTPGSTAFSNKWKEVSVRDNGGFGRAQESFHNETVWKPQVEKFESRAGITPSQRSDTLTDITVGTINQYGGLTGGMADHIKATNQSRVNSGQPPLTSNQIGIVLQDYKAANYRTHFKSSSESVKQGVLNRIRGERKLFQNGSDEPVLASVPQETSTGEGRGGASGDEDVVTPPTPTNEDLGNTAQNDHLGEKQGVAHEYSRDAFIETGDKTNNLNPNPSGNTYSHTNYSNMAKGSLSIPQKGAHVWVFFEGGDPNFPVVFGNHYSEQDYKDLWAANSEAPDYPPATADEFQTGTESGDESNIYRGKYVINERGGSMDIVSTTGRERVKLTHFRGSHYEMNPIGLNEFVNGQNQKLTKGNSFETIRGNHNHHTDGDTDTIVLGNSYRKVGDIKKWAEHVEAIKETLKPIHDKKRTFDLKRAEMISELDQSSMQEQEGEFAECPICTKEFSRIVGNEYTKVMPTECPSCDETGLSPSTQDGIWEPETMKDELPDDIEAAIDELAASEKLLANALTSDGGNDISTVAMNRVDTVGLVFNDLEAYRKDEAGKFVPTGVSIDENGIFPDYVKAPLIENVHVDSFPGGDYTLMACNKISMIAGANGLSLKTLGKLDTFGTITNIAAEQLNLTARSEISLDAPRIDFSTDTLSFRPRMKERNGEMMQNTHFESNASIAKNLTVLGSAHIDGGLSVNHLTGPIEEHYGDLKGGYSIGTVTVDGQSYTVTSIPCRDVVSTFGIALQLEQSQEDVRTNVAKDMVKPTAIPARLVSEPRRVEDTPSIASSPEDDPYINEHGDGAEETIDSQKNFEEQLESVETEIIA